MTFKGKIKTAIIIIISAAVLFAAFAVTGKSVMKLVYPIKYSE